MKSLRQSNKSRFVVGNWKMNLSVAASRELAQQLTKCAPKNDNCTIAIAPSYPALPICCEVTQASHICVGAQNLCQFEPGAYTGEVSAQMLLELGCCFAIVGHSERRQLYRESNEICGARAKMSLQSGLDTIFCVGETVLQRQENQTTAVLKAQLEPLIELLKDPQFRARTLIAYEPVWAIGTGLTASTSQIAEAHNMIRQYCGADIPILYGGSVNPSNFTAILEIDNVSGGLIGGASLDITKFTELINS